MEQVASLIKEEIGILFTREFNDPSYGFLTVTDVLMSADLKIAKVYVSILGNADVRGRTMNLLEAQKPGIRHIIGSHIRLKFTPEIHFYLDDTLDRVARIHNLIKQIHKDDQ